jgi:hypothetical protein
LGWGEQSLGGLTFRTNSVSAVANKNTIYYLLLVPAYSSLIQASALFHEDKQELSSVLEFYHEERGSNSKEIFAAAWLFWMSFCVSMGKQISMKRIAGQKKHQIEYFYYYDLA